VLACWCAPRPCHVHVLLRLIEERRGEVALAKAANQWEIENQAVPAEPPLSEADRADAEWFLGEMLVIYPILGVDAFESAAEEISEVEAGKFYR
jgi:hypothetical protein